MLSGIPAYAIKSSWSRSIGLTDKVLVLLQLNGGNDGLNTLIPLDQYANLFKHREDIILSENEALSLETNIGLHPVMQGVKNLYDAGKVSIIQGVGYPDQNRSHFRSKDIWMTASPSDTVYSTGWLGRAFQNNFPDYPEAYPNASHPDPFAIKIGNESSKTCQGSGTNYSVAVDSPENSSAIPEGYQNNNLQGVYGDRINYLQNIFRQTNAYGGNITDAYGRASDHSGLYPDIAENSLAQQLNIVGNLIEGGLQTTVYIVSIGSFDTHGDQAEAGDSTSGRHPILLNYLSNAIASFQNHVEAIGKEKKVLGMTFSEFGRRIKANGSYGTDHGSAAPMFLFGDCVQGGIIGDNPEIADEVGNKEGVAMQHDFRSVYATVLRDWFDIEESTVRELFDMDAPLLPILNDCDPILNTDDPLLSEGIRLSPSPARNYIDVQFNAIEPLTHIQVFDTLGHAMIKFDGMRYPIGNHNKTINVSSLKPGGYIVRVQSGALIQTKRFVKL